MAKHRAHFATTVALAAILSACGGGGRGDRVASAPPPPVTPAPTPTPTPTPTATVALVAPALTDSPVSPVATPGGPTFANPGADTVFPLVLTAVAAGVGGDVRTTSEGGTLNLDAESGQLSLTINNLGLTNAFEGSTVPGGNVMHANAAADLDYARYGFWDVHSADGRYYVHNSGAWLAGYTTPAANIPLAGTATYTGAVRGQYLYSYAYYEYLFGKVQLTADFGARSLAGLMTNLTVTSSDVTINPPLNDISFIASIDPSRNLFTGTTGVASAQPGRLFSANSAGAITGRFFGPSAQEVGAVFTLTDGSHRLIGSFGARGN